MLNITKILYISLNLIYFNKSPGVTRVFYIKIFSNSKNSMIIVKSYYLECEFGKIKLTLGCKELL